MNEVAIDVLTFLVGSGCLGLAAHKLLPGLSRSMVAGYVAVAAVAVGPALFTTRTQVALDYAYQFSPWRGELATPPAARNPLLSDIALQILPFRHLVRDRLLDGELPLWSHELGTGQPLLGNAQSAPFSPLHLMSLHLPPERAMTVTAAWQILLALLGMHLLARSLDVGVAGASLAAVGYALSTFSIGWLYYPLAMCAAWIPILLAAALAVMRGRTATLGFTACLVGLLTCGHPQAMVLGVLATAIVVMFSVRRPGGLEALAGLRRVVLGGAAAFLMTAPILVAIGQTLLESERWANVQEGASTPRPVTLRALLPIVAPLAFGSPRFGNWSGPGNFQESATLYVGMLPIALGLAGIRRRKGTAILMLVGLAALLISVGILRDLVSEAPWLAVVFDRRVRLLWTLVAALAAGRGLEIALSSRRSGRVAAVLSVAVGGAAVGLMAPSSSAWPLAWRAVVIGAIAVSVILLIGTAGRWRGPVLVSVTVCELLVLALPYNPAANLRWMNPPPSAVQELRRLSSLEGPATRTAALGGRYLGYLPAIDGLWDPRGWDPARPGETSRSTRRHLRGNRPGSEILLKEDFDRAFLDSLGVRYVLAGPRSRLPRDWSPVWRQGDQVIWRNPSARSIFVGGASHSPSDGIPEAPLVERIEPLPNGFRLGLRAVTIPQQIDSSVSWAPGWRAFAPSGRRRVVRRVGGFLGVVAEPGDQSIELRYSPRGWAAAVVLALAGLVLATFQAVRELGRPRGRVLA